MSACITKVEEGVLTMQKFISTSLANLCRKRLPYQRRELYYALVLLDTRDYHSHVRTTVTPEASEEARVLTRSSTRDLSSPDVSGRQWTLIKKFLH